MISSRTYFRLSLLLPVLIPALVALFLRESDLVGIFVVPLVFGGVPYIPFGIFMFWKLGELKTAKEMRSLVFWSPYIFIPLQMFSWIVYVLLFVYDNSFAELFAGAFISAIMIALIAVIVCYFYVLLSFLIYLPLKHFDVIKDQ